MISLTPPLSRPCGERGWRRVARCPCSHSQGAGVTGYEWSVHGPQLERHRPLTPTDPQVPSPPRRNLGAVEALGSSDPNRGKQRSGEPDELRCSIIQVQEVSPSIKPHHKALLRTQGCPSSSHWERR